MFCFRKPAYNVDVVLNSNTAFSADTFISHPQGFPVSPPRDRVTQGQHCLCGRGATGTCERLKLPLVVCRTHVVCEMPGRHFL